MFSTDLHQVVKAHSQNDLSAALEAIRDHLPEGPARDTIERLIIGAQWFKDIHELQQLDMFSMMEAAS